MTVKSRPASGPAWLDPANDRKTPYTDAELDMPAADFIAMNADTAAWRDLVAKVGEREAAAVVRQRLAARDPLSPLNWTPVASTH